MSKDAYKAHSLGKSAGCARHFIGLKLTEILKCEIQTAWRIALEFLSLLSLVVPWNYMSAAGPCPDGIYFKTQLITNYLWYV